MEPEKKHGGRRTGSGRKKKGAKAFLVYLTDQDLSDLDAKPWQRSKKIRSLIRWYAGKQGRPNV